MLLLAIDTSTSAVAVALHDGDAVLAAFAGEAGRPRHGEVLAPAVADLVASVDGVSLSDVTGVAVGVGPGPFTGLRVGLVTARVLGATLDIPVHGVCSLDVLAADATLDVDFLVATDARRREVYFARYSASGERRGDAAVDKPSVVADAHPGVPVVGEGAALYPDAFPAAYPPLLPSAATLARVVASRLRDGGELLAPDPLYLRRPDATPPGQRKAVSAP